MVGTGVSQAMHDPSNVGSHSLTTAKCSQVTKSSKPSKKMICEISLLSEVVNSFIYFKECYMRLKKKKTAHISGLDLL